MFPSPFLLFHVLFPFWWLARKFQHHNVLFFLVFAAKMVASAATGYSLSKNPKK